MKNYKKLLFSLIILVWEISSYGNSIDIKETSDMLCRTISMIGQKYSENDVRKENFEILFPEKNGEMLLFKRFPEKDFWEICFIYVKDQKNETVTYTIAKDYSKAKQNCKNLILLLINELGNSFKIQPAKLDSSISESLPGYAMIWNKGKINIALKFGPLEKNIDKFQLQITIYQADDLKNLINIEQDSKLTSAEMWETIKQYYSLSLKFN